MPMGKLPGYMLIMGMPGGGRGCSKPSRKAFFWKRGPFCAMVTCSRRSPTCNPHLDMSPSIQMSPSRFQAFVHGSSNAQQHEAAVVPECIEGLRQEHRGKL